MRSVIAFNIATKNIRNPNFQSCVSALREKLGLNFRLFFYVHGMATIGYWPLLKYKLGAFLCSHDVFVVTCEGDKKITNKLDEIMKMY